MSFSSIKWLLVALALSVSACASRGSDCQDNGNCGGAMPTSTSSSNGGANSTSSGGGSDTTSSTSTGGPDCSGDPTSANIVEACAVFVKSGANGKTGTRSDPVGDLAAAIELAAKSGKRVYACGDFDGPALPTEPFDLWGGFECPSKWTWGGKVRSALTAPAGIVPLIVDVDGEVSVHAFSISAAAAEVSGGSSVAVVFGSQAVATVDRTDITAGAGLDGGTMDGVPDTGAAAVPPTAGSATCSGATSPAGATLTCADGSVLQAGSGGGGGIVNGSLIVNPRAGGDGLINGLAVTTGGGAQSGFGGCSSGKAGAVGGAGSNGDGATAETTTVDIGKPSDGKITVDGSGKVGGIGKPGQPGSGGGGSDGASTCHSGGTGGAGMTGGCGGGGGLPGLGGGSSIGILSLGGSLTLEKVTIAVAAAGAGGPGGAGAGGGSGAIHPSSACDPTSTDASTGCPGAAGGDGGLGGAGGGGRGGHALDVALMSRPRVLMLGSSTTWSSGQAGAAGTTVGANKAEGGHSGVCWNFATHAACP